MSKRLTVSYHLQFTRQAKPVMFRFNDVQQPQAVFEALAQGIRDSPGGENADVVLTRIEHVEFPVGF